ncbi:sal-like protein 1 [Tubulanus polymorphus]|uniref:sal-like protein 1 n=1 Tax=Tubulanus polymorphus TaxID=672921 RepID=UPI003DA574B2
MIIDTEPHHDEDEDEIVDELDETDDPDELLTYANELNDDNNKENIDDSNRLCFSPRSGRGEGELDDLKGEYLDDENLEDDKVDDVDMMDDIDGADVDEDMEEDKQGCSESELLAQNLGLGNIVLGPLMNTKHAVAQFAENNLSPSEVATLQATLFSLQQQQLMQLQLIQRLQHQLVGQPPGPNGQPPSLPPHSLQALQAMLPNGLQSLNGLQMLHQSSPAAAVANLSSKSHHHHHHHHVSPPPSEQPENLSPRGNPINPNSNEASSPSMPPTKSAFEILRQEANNLLPSPPDNDHPLNLINNNKDSSSIDRSVYASDDPFFKHKCRFCQKVFGSDSALQIHIRSHTGERPFKCNICGNRFSTRGNLKVHFSRHKAKYPHIKMNPNPVPEHLDKLHPPLLNQSALPQDMTSSSSSTSTTPGYGIAPNTPLEQPRPSSTPPSGEMIKREEPEHPDEPTTPTSQSGHCPAVGSEPPSLISPDVTSPAASIRSAPSLPTTPIHPIYSMPLTSTPLHVPMPIHGHHTMAGMPLPGTLPMMGMDNPFFRPPMRSSTKTEDPLEQFMEIDKSETSKLEELVHNIDTKVTDPNQCAICHRVLSCKSALQMHYRIHTGERPFKCKICGRAFTTKGNLKTHMGVHRAKPPIRMLHQCPVCHKQFTNSLVLQQHIRIHTADQQNSSALDMSRHMEFIHNHEMMAAGMNHHYGLPHHHPALGLSLPPMRHSLGELDLSSRAREFRESQRDMRSPSPPVQQQQHQRSGSAPLLEKHNHEETTGGRDSHQSTPGPVRQSSPSPRDNQPMNRPPSNSGSITSQSSDEGGNQSHSVYSTSLAALEQHVRAMDPTRPNFEMMPHPRPLDMSTGRSHSPPSIYNNRTGAGSPNSAISSQPGRPNSPPDDAIKDSISENDDYPKEQLAAPPLMSPFGSFHHQGSPFSAGIGALDLTSQMGEKFTTCNICLKTFACRSALDIHYRSHTKERPFKCEVCDRGFSTRGNMKQHMLTHKIRDLPSQAFNHGSEDSNSQISTKSEDNIIPLVPVISHVITAPQPQPPSSSHSEEPPDKKPALSPVASQPSSSSSLTPPSVSHLNSSSEPGCGSPFVRRPNKHQCQTCLKNFSSASALQIHIRTHTGDKPFKCTVCGKAFTTKGNLKVHMGTHMWNNGPSRRGRRIAIDHPIPMPSKEPDFMFGHRGPSELYFPYPAFHHNGISPKMNEIPVIQSMNGSFPHLSVAASSAADYMKMKAEAFMTMSGMKPEPSLVVSSSSPKDYSTKTGDSNNSHEMRNGMNNNNEGERINKIGGAPQSPAEQQQRDGPHNDSAWLWKTTCHLCNKVCVTPSALEMHLQSHVSGMVRDREEPKSLIA